MIAFLSAFFLVLVFFSWRGFRQWRRHKAAVAEDTAAGGPTQPAAAAPRISAVELTPIQEVDLHLGGVSEDDGCDVEAACSSAEGAAALPPLARGSAELQRRTGVSKGRHRRMGSRSTGSSHSQSQSLSQSASLLSETAAPAAAAAREARPMPS